MNTVTSSAGTAPDRYYCCLWQEINKNFKKLPCIPIGTSNLLGIYTELINIYNHTVHGCFDWWNILLKSYQRNAEEKIFKIDFTVSLLKCKKILNPEVTDTFFNSGAI